MSQIIRETVLARRRVFISGTDTDVGKTLIAAGLLRWDGFNGEVRYWKPVQTGVGSNLDDTETVASKLLVSKKTRAVLEPCYRFKEPVSPHLAASREGVLIDIHRILESGRDYLRNYDYLIVEGAGGLMVPYRDDFLQIDLIRELGLDVLLVVHDKLGAINHTLLSLEALRRRGIVIAGVILNRAGALDGNREAIEHFGKTSVLLRISEKSDIENVIQEVTKIANQVFC